MKAVFRVDASVRMGTGHVVRCCTLAEIMRRRGADIIFVCRAQQGNLIEVVAAAGFPVTVLSAPPESAGDAEDYADWLGVSEAQDAAETIAALAGNHLDWLIVDHYAIGAEWERALRPYCQCIMVIDDLANRRHDCDLLLDQNYVGQGCTRYASLVPPECRQLLGPRYALLKEEYRIFLQIMPPRDGVVRRIFVFFGGVDCDNITGLSLQALSAPDFRDIEVDVVVGTNNPHRDGLERQAAARPRTAIHRTRPHLADMMAAASLSIGAGGTTSWERLCMGLPALVVAVADNQLPACEALAADGLIRFAGRAGELDPPAIRRHFTDMIADPGELVEQSLRGQRLVDGYGARRVVELISPTSSDALTLRDAKPSDAALYFSWVNDPEVRQQSLNTAAVDWTGHNAWYASRLADPRCRMFVLEADGLPVGQVRFEREGLEAGIGLSMDPLVRGRRWAEQMVIRGVARLDWSAPLTLKAVVKEDNLASARLFRALGFSEEAGGTGLQVFRAPGERFRSCV